MKMREGFWLGLQPYLSWSSFMFFPSESQTFLLTMRSWAAPVRRSM